MGPKNRASNWPYNRFSTISDGTITGMHCTSLRTVETALVVGLLSKYFLRFNQIYITTNWLSLSNRSFRSQRKLLIDRFYVLSHCDLKATFHCSRSPLWHERGNIDTFHLMIPFRSKERADGQNENLASLFVLSLIPLHLCHTQRAHQSFKGGTMILAWNFSSLPIPSIGHFVDASMQTL